jgi:transcriptional regulator with XRE-family HTH domain
MSATTEKPNQIHQGRNIKRFREMLGLKQEALAYALGEEWSQKRVSLLEQKEVIEDDLLNQVAAILKVPVEAIKNFDTATPSHCTA